MTKQEEIREGIRTNILIAIKWAVNEGMTDFYLNLHVDELLKFLHSKGIVIKVDELPEYDNYNDLTRELDSRVKYVAVAPLIEGK